MTFLTRLPVVALLALASASFAQNTPSVLPRPDFHFPGNVGRTYLDSDPAPSGSGRW